MEHRVGRLSQDLRRTVPVLSRRREVVPGWLRRLRPQDRELYELYVEETGEVSGLWCVERFMILIYDLGRS